MKRIRSAHMLTAFVVIAVGLLLTFAVWCALLMSRVSTVREDVETRVGWLQALHQLRAEAGAEPADAAARLEGLRTEIGSRERVGPELQALASEPVGEPDEHVDALVPAIRRETAELSQQLGDHWSSINWLAAIAMVLAASTLILLVYVRFVLLRRARRAVAGLQAYLRDADRLAAVGTLAAGVAHELSNPLTFVVTSLELLNDELSAQASARASAQELAVEALRGTERVMGIVRDLRAIARPTFDELEPCDVEACLDATLNITRREIQNVAQVVRDYAGVPRVIASEGRLGQLFLNLVINATHAMADGPRPRNELRITTRLRTPTQVEIEIRDTGPGIPEELRDRVFEPFVTSKPMGKGTGLGLFVCHNIVRSLDGVIDIQSSDAGTTITIVLPVDPQTIPDTALRSPRQASESRI